MSQLLEHIYDTEQVMSNQHNDLSWPCDDLGITYLLVSQQELAPPEQVTEVKLPGPPSVAPQSLLHRLLFYLQRNRTINVRHQTYMYSADTFSYDEENQNCNIPPTECPYSHEHLKYFTI